MVGGEARGGEPEGLDEGGDVVGRPITEHGQLVAVDGPSPDEVSQPRGETHQGEGDVDEGAAASQPIAIRAHQRGEGVLFYAPDGVDAGCRASIHRPQHGLRDVVHVDRAQGEGAITDDGDDGRACQRAEEAGALAGVAEDQGGAQHDWV